jgi:Histidine kinase/Histidine kinase-, DNA gyrase B-, and HSP90-like ATPase
MALFSPLPGTAPTRPQPFFEDKIRAFWTLQSVGWAGWFVLRAISGFATGQDLTFLATTLVSGITGFSLTLLLSVIFRRLMQQRALVMWPGALTAVSVATVIYSFVDASMVAIQPGVDDAPFTTLFLVPFFLDAVTLGGWSALYFAINYFLRVEQQADQLAALELQATTSQLAMLRYQINPHFLFNTLNSISTLVLLKQTEPANAMLSRLSSFLRYTLVNEPTAEVTLAQEVETLKLYLDIEKMRFEDRLRVRFDVDPRVSDVLLPSLLLQPLIENAIKYAVTPSEEGADIVLSAHLVGQNVRVVVSDSGGGLNPDMSVSTTSTGVGLANIRDRLAQAYGDQHRLQTRHSPGGGFTVTSELPYGVPRPPVDAVPVETKASLTA